MMDSGYAILDQLLATERFLAEGVREAAALNAIGSYVQAAGYSCSSVRGWRHVHDKLQCVFDLYIDDICLGDMSVAVTFSERDTITNVDGGIVSLLDIRSHFDG